MELSEFGSVNNNHQFRINVIIFWNWFLQLEGVRHFGPLQEYKMWHHLRKNSKIGQDIEKLLKHFDKHLTKETFNLVLEKLFPEDLDSEVNVIEFDPTFKSTVESFDFDRYSAEVRKGFDGKWKIKFLRFCEQKRFHAHALL